MGLDKYENAGSFEEMAAQQDAEESVEETKDVEATSEETTDAPAEENGEKEDE